jgi:hypothetical protein
LPALPVRAGIRPAPEPLRTRHFSKLSEEELFFVMSIYQLGKIKQFWRAASGESVPQESSADVDRSPARCRAQPTLLAGRRGDTSTRNRLDAPRWLSWILKSNQLLMVALAVRQVDRALGQRYRKLVRGET